MTGKIILVPGQCMMDALAVMERQNDIGKTDGDRLVIGVGRDPNSGNKDFQLVAVAESEETFSQIVADFKESLPEVYVREQNITSK